MSWTPEYGFYLIFLAFLPQFHSPFNKKTLVLQLKPALGGLTAKPQGGGLDRSLLFDYKKHLPQHEKHAAHSGKSLSDFLWI